VAPPGSSADLDGLRRGLLRWYSPRRSAYPWRRTRDPYATLVSEVMLQQTQAPRVVAPFEQFMGRFPTIAALARAERSDVIRSWDGLGYNRRAVSLSRASRFLVQHHDGLVPSDVADLRRLPGVGPYTAAAVASIAFGAPVAAIDTNVRRVVGRVLAGRDDVPDGDIERLAAACVDGSPAGDWNQAVMDLGRSVCRPRPRCDDCPLRGRCPFAHSTPVAPPAGRQASFQGSMRQVRGDVVRELRDVASATLAGLAARTGHDRERIERAVAALVADGLLETREAELPGSGRARVRLAR
jgi:A/G-specific adenine glycosylase